jgi:peptidoglycan/LPS O-acetylase OafA/YrhL
MMIGYAYQRLKIISPQKLHMLGVTLLLLLAVLLLQMNINDVTGGVLGLKRSLSACLLISSAVCFESVFSKISSTTFQFLRYMGDVSYSTYLVHPLVIGILLHYVGKPDSLSGELLLLLASTLTIMMVSHLSYQYIETGPAIKKIRNRLLNFAGRKRP